MPVLVVLRTHEYYRSAPGLRPTSQHRRSRVCSSRLRRRTCRTRAHEATPSSAGAADPESSTSSARFCGSNKSSSVCRARFLSLRQLVAKLFCLFFQRPLVFECTSSRFLVLSFKLPL